MDDSDNQERRPADDNPLLRGLNKKSQADQQAEAERTPAQEPVQSRPGGWMPNSRWQRAEAERPRAERPKKTTPQALTTAAPPSKSKIAEMASLARDRRRLRRKAVDMAADFWQRGQKRAISMASRNPINRLILSKLPQGRVRNCATTACGCSTCCAGCSSCAAVMPCGLPLLILILIMVVFMFAIVGQVPEQAKPLFCQDDILLGIDCSEGFAIAFDGDEIPAGAVEDYKAAEEATGVPWFYLMAWEKMTTNFGRADLSTGEALPTDLIDRMTEQTQERLDQLQEEQDLSEAELDQAEETLFKEQHMNAVRLSSPLRGGSYGLVLLTADEWERYGTDPDGDRLLNPWLRADAVLALGQMLSARYADELWPERIATDAAQVDLTPIDREMLEYLSSTWNELQNEARKTEFVQYMYADTWPSDPNNPRSEERITLEERRTVCYLVKDDVPEVTDEQCQGFEAGSNQIALEKDNLRDEVALFYDPEREGVDRVSDWPKLRILMGSLMNLDSIWGAEQSANFTIPARDNEGRTIPDAFQNVNIYPYGINLYARTAFEGWLIYEQTYLNNTFDLGGALSPADVPAMQFWRPHLEAAAAKYHVRWEDLAAYMDTMTSFGRNVGDTAPSEERRWSEPGWVEGTATQAELVQRLLQPYSTLTPELRLMAERTATAMIEAEAINCLPAWDSFLGMSPAAIEGADASGEEEEGAGPINVPCLNPLHGITADGHIGPAAFRLADWAGPNGYGTDVGNILHTPYDPVALTEALARKLHAEARNEEEEPIPATTEPNLLEMMPAWASMMDCAPVSGSQSEPILVIDENDEQLGSWPYCRALSITYQRAKAYRSISSDLAITDTWLKPNTILVGKAMAAELGFTGNTWVPLAVQVMLETGGNINFNNPTGLTGDGGALVWDGQTGWTARLCPINNFTKQPECHYFAVFATLDDGARASAQNYAGGSTRHGYDDVLAAGRAGDWLALARAIEASSWNTDHYSANPILASTGQIFDPTSPQHDGNVVKYSRQVIASATPIYTGDWQWPLRGSYVVTQEYGPTSFSSFHSGLDMAYYGGCGGTIHASASGTVVADGQPYAKWGDTAIGVIIEHGPDLKTLYWHMSSEIVSVGQRVAVGDVLGYEGRTGQATGCHLHFEVLRSEHHTNPRLTLPARPGE